MRNAIVPLMLAIHVGIPLALIAWTALGTAPNRLYWMSRTAMVAAIFGFLWHATGWSFISVYARPIFVVLFAVAAMWSARHLPAAPWFPDTFLWNGLGTSAMLFITGFAGLAIATLASGDELPPGPKPVDLTFPLKNGTYWIYSGGSAPGGNRHLRVKDNPDFADYRGQAYALDIIALNSAGSHASGLYPSEPAEYAIFGKTVYAPCRGEVVETVESRPDLSPPNTDRDNPPGNYVFLKCGDARILLAHLKQGSISVKEGDTVDTGDPVGEVGNSGNTSEPHLHIHAQRPAKQGPYLSGDPLPVTFEGRFLPHATVVTRSE